MTKISQTKSNSKLEREAMSFGEITKTVNPLISIIIPLRSNDNIDVIQRLSWKKIPQMSELEVIVVDDGSYNGREIKAFCDSRSWNYVYLNTLDAPFSLSRARNAGLKNASGEFVYFEDVDFLHRSNFYEAIIQLTFSFDDVPFNFASVPTLFLNEKSSKDIIEKISDRKEFDRIFTSYINRLQFINPDHTNDLCDSYALMGSNIIVRRELCFHVGLYDEFFNGWGGEDRDFIYRLLAHNSKLSRPENFAATKNWKPHRTNAYEGWRAAYRLHGDWLKCLGIYAVHIHHPENAWKDPDIRRFNFDYAERKAVEIESGTRKIDPTPIPNAASLNVFIGRNPVFYNDQVMRALGNVKVIEPHQTIDVKSFADTIKSYSPIRVFFQNPYGNEWLKAVWREAKAAGIECVCAERGALPWSIYFDAGGFCNDSHSYDYANWQNSIPIDAKAYIQNLRDSSQFLEPQGARNTHELLKKINPEKKTILVLLQSLTDTTTKHFCQPLVNYQAFLDLIKSIDQLGKYNVLVKNHPLNKTHPLPSTGMSVDSYKLYDLFDLTDTVITLNSGAGLLALGAGKKVINSGTSYYAKDGLAIQASTIESIIEYVEAPGAPDMAIVDKFFGYLVNELYSFATWDYSTRDASDKTRLSLMKDIRFNILRIGEIRAVDKRLPLDPYSLIMDPFAYHNFTQKKKAALSLPKKAENKVQSVVVSNKMVVGTIAPNDVFAEPGSAKRNDSSLILGSVAAINSIKRKRLFVIYKAFYSPFLKKKQKERLNQDPVDFLTKASHPVSKIGKSIFLK
ncbi:glycosyltransferase [Ochrobactrum sp. SD129]|nr:glycosyltransferase [Ochrobactrum sp. SD129]